MGNALNNALNFWVEVSKNFLWVYALSVLLMYAVFRTHYWLTEKEDDTDENVENHWKLIWTPAYNTVGVFIVTYLILWVLLVKLKYFIQDFIDDKWDFMKFKRRFFGLK